MIDVNSTMNDLLDTCIGLVAPHICKACHRPGDALCQSCFFDIVENPYERCIVCRRELSPQTITRYGNLCSMCVRHLPFSHAFAVGERRGALKKLVGDFKYNSERASAKTIAKLLDLALPALPENTVITYITTAPPDIRARGFDHARLIAQSFAHIRGLKIRKLLCREIFDSQHDKNAHERQILAAKMFSIVRRPDDFPRLVLLIDDIWTTGATTIAAAKLLRKAGATDVQLAVAVRQTTEAEE